MFNLMNNSSNNSNNNNATANSTTTATASSDPASPPQKSNNFDSTSQSNQNGFYQHQHDTRMPMSGSTYPFIPQNPMTMFPGPLPIHPMNVYAMPPMNPYNMFHPSAAMAAATAQQQQHQRSSSYPNAPGNQSQSFSPAFSNGSNQNQGQTTVNPQLISSPTLNANWTRQQDNSYFPSPPQNAPVGFQSPYLNNPRSLPHSHNGHTPLFTSPETNFDGLGTNAPGASTSVSVGNQRGTRDSKNLSNRSGSDDTNPRDSTKRHSAPIPRGPPSTTSDIVLLTGGTDALLGPPATTTGLLGTSRRPRAPPARRQKRRRLSEDLSEDDDDDDDDDDGGRHGGLKLHKACASCRKQKGKCVKKDSEEKCRMCRIKGLSCTFEPRPERKQPVQRKLLIEQLRKKDAIIESFRQMLRPHMLLEHGLTTSENNPSTGSPPSSAAHEEPLRRQVLEWLDKAEASRTTTVDFASTLGGMGMGMGGVGADGRAYNDSSSDEADPPEDEVSTGTSALSHPGLPQRHSFAGQTENMATQQSRTHTTLNKSSPDGPRPSRSRSPRINRNSTMAMHPLELLARASLRGTSMMNALNPSRQSTSSVGDSHSFGPPGSHVMPSPVSQVDIGVARHDYFVSGDVLEAQRARELGLRRIEIDRGLSEEPKLLRKGLIVPDEVDKLFEIFYEKLNVTVSLLDPVLHTPATTFARCPLLFTVVCAVAARYYTERPELYSIAMHFAMTSAASSLMDSKKSVELCQAYLLLSVWPLPSRKYDEDRAWLYLGLAIRMAMDLNLHLPTNVDIVSEQQEREILNRTRTWIVCFNMDRSTSAQLGKPMTIREDYMIRNSSDWYTRSEFNQPYDLHLCQSTALMRIMSRFQETVYGDTNSPSGIREDVDLRKMAFEFDDEITAWEKDATKLFAAKSDPSNPGSVYRCHLLPFHANYSRLVILSFGFQYSFRMGLLSPNDDLVMRCLDAAQNVISKLINDTAVRSYLRYAPDGHLVFASFASAFLLKLLRHKFVHLLSEERRSKIIPVVERFIRALNDPSVSIDDSHTPKIYARFLAGLLQKHHTLSQRMEHDANVHTNTQDRQVTGLSIDLSNVHRNGNISIGPLSPPSPHPSIQVTPPPVGDHNFGYILHNPNDAHFGANLHDHADTEMLGQGSDIRLDISGASGSGTVHPMDEIARREEDEDIPSSLNAINDSYWQHGLVPGLVPWLDFSMPVTWEKDFVDHQNISSLEG